MRYDSDKIVISSCLITALFLFMPYGVSAFEISRFSDVPIRNDIALSPAKVELNLDPGTQSVKYLSIINRMGQDAAFSIDFENFSPSEELSGGVTLDKTVDGLDSSLKQYISADIKQFTLAHGERARIQVTINLPKNVKPGGRYAAVLISGMPVKNEAGAAKVVTRLGSLFFVKVNGQINQSGSLKDVSFRDNKIELVFENTGDIYLNPYGIINIYDEERNLMSAINVEPWFVLPKSTRTRTVTIQDESLESGKYIADISINRGYGDIVDRKDLNFELIMPAGQPLKLYWGLLFTVLLMLLYKYFFYGKKKF